MDSECIELPSGVRCTFTSVTSCAIFDGLSSHTDFEPGQCGKPSDHTGAVISVTYSTTVDVLTDLMSKCVPEIEVRRTYGMDWAK